MDTNLLIEDKIATLLKFKKMLDIGELSNEEYLELVQDLTDITEIEHLTEEVETLVKMRAALDLLKQLAGLIIK